MPQYDLVIDDTKDKVIGYFFTSHKGRKKFLSNKRNRHLKLSKIVYSIHDANEYFANHNVSKIVHEVDIFKKNKGEIKKCILCDKNVRRGQLCSDCAQSLDEIREMLQEKGITKYPLTIRCAFIIRKKYCPKGKDIFEYIKENPTICWNVFRMTKDERKNEKDKFYRKRFIEQEVNKNNVPQYITNFFRDVDYFSLLDVRGTEKKPEVFVKCRACGKEFWVEFHKLEIGELGHQCVNNTSSGEYLVIEYLKSKGFDVLTQHDTLQCINPKTGYVLPYDGQINTINKHSKYNGIIIEVQGAQHEHYVGLFHSSTEAFEYQKYKDNIKKEFAISNNYLFVEIFYNQIKNGEYKTILQKALDEII